MSDYNSDFIGKWKIILDGSEIGQIDFDEAI